MTLRSAEAFKSNPDYPKELSYTVNNRGCWVFDGCKDNNGYGRLKVNGKAYRAHQYHYLKFVGPIPPGMVIRHQCQNTSCCNPKHLLIGTVQDNVDDRERDKKTFCTSGHQLDHTNSYRFNNRTICRICKAKAVLVNGKEG